MLFQKILNCCLENKANEIQKFIHEDEDINWSIVLTMCIDIENGFMVEKLCSFLKEIDISVVYTFAINRGNVSICNILHSYHPFDDVNYKNLYFYALKKSSKVMLYWLIDKSNGCVFENTIEYLAKHGNYELLNTLRKHKEFPFHYLCQNL
jgi:hypothetical protein